MPDLFDLISEPEKTSGDIFDSIGAEQANRYFPPEIAQADEQAAMERDAAAGIIQRTPPATPIPFLEKPLVQFPHLPVTNEQSFPSRFGSAVLNKAGDFVSGVTSFDGLIGLFPPVGAAQIIAQAPELVAKVKRADETPPGSPERIDAGLDVVAAVGSLGALGAGAKAGLKRGAKAGEVPKVESDAAPKLADTEFRNPATEAPRQASNSEAIPLPTLERKQSELPEQSAIPQSESSLPSDERASQKQQDFGKPEPQAESDATRQMESVSDLHAAAQSSPTEEVFIRKVQRSSIESETTGKANDLLEQLYAWENSTPENQARFKYTGWFGIASEFWKERKAPSVPDALEKSPTSLIPPKEAAGPTSTKNEVTNVERESRGIAPAVEAAKRDFGTSKIGKSIEAKAVEAKLTKGFADTAQFDPITIKDQAERASGLVRSNPALTRAIVRGESPLPDGLRGTSLITAVEEHLTRHPDAQTAYELANSPLTSATSAAAQEMRLMAERIPDGITAAFHEIREARRAGSKLRGESPDIVIESVRKEIVKNASKRPTWEAFVSEITCV